ncbi:MAG: methyltransferase [Gammaproteobacteria bacterium]
MKKYGGKLIYSGKDEYGPIEIVEFYNRMRSLHFGNKTQQTGMLLYNPIILIHKYTQAMLTSLSYQTPEKVLILGLGAGSIAKFFLHHYHKLELSAVDLRPEVVRLGQEYFNLSRENDRFNIYYQNAEEFINTQSNSKKYDLILIDLFLTRKDQDINVNISPFVDKLPNLLSPTGQVYINLIGTEPNNYPALEAIRSAFNNNLYAITVDKSNTILLAGNTDPKILLDSNHGIDFTSLKKKLKIPLRHYTSNLTNI